MKILLVGNGDRRNRGCEAITITTVELLRERISNVDIEVLSDSPSDKYYEEAYKIKVSKLSNEKYIFASRILCNPLLLRLLPGDYFAEYGRPLLLPYVQKLKCADIILSLGGDTYSGDYGIPYYHWNLALWAKKYNKPFVIWGASVGPFDSAKSLKVARQGLKGVSLITAREGETVEYLRTLNYAGELVRVCDSAFLLRPQQVEYPIFQKNAEIVGFNISPLYFRYTALTSREVLDIAIQFLSNISKKYNILLIPHVMIGDKWTNDAQYMKLITKEVDDAILVNPEYNSRQLKYLIAGCNYFIGARTHATIAALSQAVPTLSLGYSMKARGLNYDLFGSREFLIESNEYNLSNLSGKFEYLVLNRQKCKTALKEKQYSITTMINAGLDSLMRLCGDRM